jgi:predicted RNA binding protein YcfA (HicA-like mRNA interferase family)
MAAARVIRRFEKLGFEIDHVTGSHHIMKHTDGRRVSVPRHRVVKTGLLLGQLKRIGISWDNFREGL